MKFFLNLECYGIYYTTFYNKFSSLKFHNINYVFFFCIIRIIVLYGKGSMAYHVTFPFHCTLVYYNQFLYRYNVNYRHIKKYNDNFIIITHEVFKLPWKAKCSSLNLIDSTEEFTHIWAKRVFDDAGALVTPLLMHFWTCQMVITAETESLMPTSSESSTSAHKLIIFV